MPIRPEFRHLYRGPAWRAVRERILTRAGNCCERCRVPNRKVVLRAFSWWTLPSLEAIVFKQGGAINGETLIQLPWAAPGIPPRMACFGNAPCRWVGIVLTVAHLNHDPTDNRDENLQALCQWCHLDQDKRFHAANARRTRCTKKDAARPLLQGGANAISDPVAY